MAALYSLWTGSWLLRFQETCEVLRPTCMSVCVYVRLFAVLAYLKTHMSKLHEIFSVYLIFYRGALLFRTIMQYVPVLWMALFFSNNGAYTIKIYSSACTLLWDGVEIKHGRIFKQEAVSRSLWELLVASVAAVTCRQADVVHAKLQSNDVGRDCRLCTRDWPDHPRAQRDSPGAERTDQTTHELNVTHLGGARTGQTSHELNLTHLGAARTGQTSHELNLTHPGQHGLTRPPTSSTWLTWGQHGLTRPPTSSTWLTWGSTDWPDHPRAQRDSPGGNTDWPDHQRAGPAVLLHVRHERLQRLRIAAPPTQPAAAPPPAQVACVGVAVAMTSRVDDVIVVTSRVGASAPRPAAPAPSLLWMLCFNSLNNCHMITIRTKLRGWISV